MKKIKKSQSIYVLEQFYSLLLILPLILFLAVSFKFIGYKKVSKDILKSINSLFLADKIFITDEIDNIERIKGEMLIVYCNKNIKEEFESSELKCDYFILKND
jgi:hypothetical protein